MGPCPYDHRETGCLGSDRTERSKQPRFIVLSIVPDNVKEQCSLKSLLTEELCSLKSRQLNTLQTVALLSHVKEKELVKPHGLLVPVSLTSRDASTPGLST